MNYKHTFDVTRWADTRVHKNIYILNKPQKNNRVRIGITMDLTKKNPLAVGSHPGQLLDYA